MRTRTLLLGCWVRCAMQVPRFKGPRATYTARAGLADAICACVNLGGVGATGACQAHASMAGRTACLQPVRLPATTPLRASQQPWRGGP